MHSLQAALTQSPLSGSMSRRPHYWLAIHHGYNTATLYSVFVGYTWERGKKKTYRSTPISNVTQMLRLEWFRTTDLRAFSPSLSHHQDRPFCSAGQINHMSVWAAGQTERAPGRETMGPRQGPGSFDVTASILKHLPRWRDWQKHWDGREERKTWRASDAQSGRETIQLHTWE